MLVLKRREGETITIKPPGQQPIVVHFVRLQPGQVRVGIEAEKAVEIVRTELLQEADCGRSEV